VSNVSLAPWCARAGKAAHGVAGALSAAAFLLASFAAARAQTNEPPAPAPIRFLDRAAERKLHQLRERAREARDPVAQRDAFAESVTFLAAQLGEDHWRTDLARRDVANLDFVQQLSPSDSLVWSEVTADCATAAELRRARKFGAAIETYRRALANCERVVGPDSLQTLDLLTILAVCCYEGMQRAELPELTARQEAIRSKHFPADHPKRWAWRREQAVLQHTLDGDDAKFIAAMEQCIEAEAKWYGNQGTEVGAACVNLGSMLSTRGQEGRAETYLRRGIACYDAVGAEGDAVRLEGMRVLAQLWRKMGRIEEARRMAEAAVADSKTHHGMPLPNAVLELVAVLARSGDLDGAAKMLEAFRTEYEARAPSDLATQRTILDMLQGIASERGDDAQAASYGGELVSMSRRLYGAGHRVTASALRSLGLVKARLGEREEGVRLLREALQIFLQHGGEGQVETVKTRCVVAHLLPRPDKDGRADADDEALIEWQRAAESWELARLRTAVEGTDRTWLEQIPVHATLALELATRGRAVAAWDALAAGSGRGLLDDLTWRTRAPLSADERERERELSALARTTSEAARRLETHANPDPAAREEIAQARAAANEAWLALAHLRSEFAARHGPAAGQLFAFERVQGQVDPDEALVAWVSSDSVPESGVATRCWVCVVRHAGSPRWVPTGSGGDGEWTASEKSSVQRLRDGLATGGDIGSLDEVQRLAVAPILPLLDDVRHVVVVRAGPLRGIALEPMLGARSVSYAPSATVHAWLRTTGAERRERRPSLFAVGDPKVAAINALPNTRRECESIATLFADNMLLLGEAATDSAAAAALTTSEAVNITHLHFATHGFLSPTAPQLPYLLLSESADAAASASAPTAGRIGADHIVRDWRLDADVVSLSACHSGAGASGSIDFAQALLTAGARSVVLSLWEVNDVAATLLMYRLYQNLLARPKGGRAMTKVAALAEAQGWLRGLSWDDRARLVADLGLRDDDAVQRDWKTKVTARARTPRAEQPFAHPTHWAAFILVGDPR
jgi:tetratricopeptide (TPR) repeat protein